MKEDEKLSSNSSDILNKLEKLLSATTENSEIDKQELKALIYELKALSNERVKSQDKTVERELRSEEMHQSSLVGFLVFDKTFTIQQANPTARKIMRRRKADLIGNNFLDYVMPSYHKAFNSHQQIILSTKKRQDQVLQLIKGDLKETYVILESFPILDNSEEIISIRSIIIDFTEQKLSDLKHQTELIQAAVESMLDPFAILTAERDDSDKILDFVYTYVNQSANQANELTREETIGKRLLKLYPSLIDSTIFNYMVKVVETGRPIMKEGVYMEFVNEHQTIKGTFHTRINKLEDGVIITFRDITEKIKAENMLKTAMSELEHSNKELEQFANIASHDLQEPLRMITEFTKLLSERYKNKSDPKAEEYSSFIIEGTSRMLVLLKGLLKYARIASSQAKPLELTDFNVTVQEVLTDLKFLIEENEAEVRVDLLPSLLADPVQIRQLFQNLIENAIKFHNNRRPVIKISAKAEANSWIFSVEDNGIGINSKYSDLIFTIFHRINRNEQYTGSGVGLAICKRIVERHGGRIWVKSEEGKGSTFFFTIASNNTRIS